MTLSTAFFGNLGEGRLTSTGSAAYADERHSEEELAGGLRKPYVNLPNGQQTLLRCAPLRWINRRRRRIRACIVVRQCSGHVGCFAEYEGRSRNQDDAD